MAGLIAGAPRPDGGLVGVAPEAALVDVRVYDVRDATTEDEVPVTPGYVVQGLQWVLDNARRTGIDIVNVSLTVQADPRIERLVERLWRAGIIVVAANGNRPQQGDGFASDLAEPRPGEDGASVFFPAGYQRTVAVNATTDGLPNAQPARTYVVANSLVDVAAPTAGAVTYGLNGDSCLLLDAATSWPTAQVSGLLALLKSRFPRERPGQLVTRLLVSADGRLAPQVDSPMTGAGVVQPLETLRRPVHPAEDGDLPVGQVQRDEGPVEAPAAEVDTMAAPRRAALWWGLVGGGVLLLALVLRPALIRPARRP